jgi:hypothetical protein
MCSYVLTLLTNLASSLELRPPIEWDSDGKMTVVYKVESSDPYVFRLSNLLTSSSEDNSQMIYSPFSLELVNPIFGRRFAVISLSGPDDHHNSSNVTFTPPSDAPYG